MSLKLWSKKNRKFRKPSMGSESSTLQPAPAPENYIFHSVEFDETDNGSLFSGIHIPEEILLEILSNIEPHELLALSLVCRKWCRIIKSWPLWSKIYQKHYNRIPQHLPWYVFYCLFTTKSFDNFIVNGNGEERYRHWTIVANVGDGFKIEDPPNGSDPLPLNMPEFHGKTSCFATSFRKCIKYQKIDLTKNNLLLYIIRKFKPHIYASEWVTGRFDCACSYQLMVQLFNDEDEDAIYVEEITHKVKQWEGREWKKVEMCMKNYPTNFTILHFHHMGTDNQFWAGHYGMKMAGGVLKFVFDSMKPE